MKLTDKQYSNQVFKRTSFCNESIAVWWTKRNLSDANFLDVIFQMSLQEGVDL